MLQAFKYPWRNVSFIIIILLVGFSTGCQAENNTESPSVQRLTKNPAVEKYALTIKIDELRKYVFTLASDQMEGRHTGTEGSQKAADFIAGIFESLDLEKYSQESGYFQKFQMIKKKMVESSIQSPHIRLDSWKDYMELFTEFEGAREVDMVFVGFGLSDDLEAVDINGKLAAFYQGSPESSEYSEEFERLKTIAYLRRGAVGTIIVVDREDILRKRIGQLKPYMDVERFYQHKPAEKAFHEERRIVMGENSAAKLFGISREEFQSLIKKMRGGMSVAGQLQTKVSMKTSFLRGESIPAVNIIGLLEGTEKKEECVIVSAHYDHLGMKGKQVYNGAYDNAAGIAAVIAVAKAFAAAAVDGTRPRRSVLFFLPDAEELGGVGSMHILDNPPVPLENIAVDINIDGIGREDSSRPHLKDFVHFYMSQMGRDELTTIRESAAVVSPKLRLEHREKYGGSDHIFFERAGIPVIALSTGQPKDHHKTTDTADKLDYRNIRDIARLTFACAWHIANQDRLTGQENF